MTKNVTKNETPTPRVLAARLAARGRDCLLLAEELNFDGIAAHIVSEAARAALALLRRAEEVCPGYRAGTGDANEIARALLLV